MKSRLLIIAGSDSSGGAGIQADIKAAMAMDAYAATAITAITAQSTLGVHAVHPLPIPLILQQIDAVLDDIGADAIKTGMLGDAATVAAIADRLAPLATRIPIVIDPVMTAKSGTHLLPGSALATLRDRLLPLATLITPNLPEAEILLGHPIRDPAEAATQLAQSGPAILLKGGHAEGPEVEDILVQAGALHRFRHPRIDTPHTHGTGCTTASAIAAGLAQGLSMPQAVARALDYVHAAIRHAPGFGAGHGPLNHNVRPSP